ncbi:hypothetical protein JQC67_03175 [Aurantibacter crassamenti]|uniref:hypothetical protein n=1 Tax=Aurantibacter crassamenti TaxID=1837375 RepID=UPI001939C8BD|nr:hypothetical protein [Aurantibacter crassamenti]MBM1105134.1 hypothetical protein [Aurantibacter crassamenti]
MNEIERLSIVKSSQINQALGVFIFIFGVIVTFAMVFTETFVQQMTDLVAGVVLMGIGGGMMWKATRVLKKLKK